VRKGAKKLLYDELVLVVEILNMLGLVRQLDVLELRQLRAADRPGNL
jgi:hypothetical protein